MIKLSVVHAPVGPQEGPGLDENLQSTDSEDSAMEPGDRKDDRWNPYGEEPEGNKPSDSPWRNIQNSLSGKVVGIDFDGTVTLDPKFFRGLISRIRSAGGKAHLITGRSFVEKAEVGRYLKSNGLKFDGEHYYPFPYHSDWVSWDSLMEVRVGAWKAKVLSEINADAMVDDNPIFVKQMIKRLPKLTVLMPTGEQR